MPGVRCVRPSLRAAAHPRAGIPIGPRGSSGYPLESSGAYDTISVPIHGTILAKTPFVSAHRGILRNALAYILPCDLGKCALFKSEVETCRRPVFVFHLLCPTACAERCRNAEVASAQSALRELFVLRWACVPNCFQPPRTRLLLSSIRNKTRRCWCACSTACHSLEIKGEQDQVRHPNLNSQPCGSNSPLGRCLRRSYPLPCQHMLVRAVVKNVILRRTSP